MHYIMAAVCTKFCPLESYFVEPVLAPPNGDNAPSLILRRLLDRSQKIAIFELLSRSFQRLFVSIRCKFHIREVHIKVPPLPLKLFLSLMTKKFII